LGVIFHILLTGDPPFDGDNEEEILFSVLENKLDFTKPVFK
jgi:hypothetical protein